MEGPPEGTARHMPGSWLVALALACICGAIQCWLWFFLVSASVGVQMVGSSVLQLCLQYIQDRNFNRTQAQFFLHPSHWEGSIDCGAVGVDPLGLGTVNGPRCFKHSHVGIPKGELSRILLLHPHFIDYTWLLHDFYILVLVLFLCIAVGIARNLQYIADDIYINLHCHACCA